MADCRIETINLTKTFLSEKEEEGEKLQDHLMRRDRKHEHARLKWPTDNQGRNSHMIKGASMVEIWPEYLKLLAVVILFFGVGLKTFSWGLSKAKRQGSLGNF